MVNVTPGTSHLLKRMIYSSVIMFCWVTSAQAGLIVDAHGADSKLRVGLINYASMPADTEAPGDDSDAPVVLKANVAGGMSGAPPMRGPELPSASHMVRWSVGSCPLMERLRPDREVDLLDEIPEELLKIPIRDGN